MSDFFRIFPIRAESIYWICLINIENKFLNNNISIYCTNRTHITQLFFARDRLRTVNLEKHKRIANALRL